MEGYTLLGIKLAMGIIGLVLQINLMGKGNLAPTSAMDQVQNYVLGGIIGGVIYSDSIDGKPVWVILNGKVQTAECMRNGISANDLMFKLRAAGVYEITSVKRAVLEQNGQLSIIQYGDESLRYPLIVDGQLDSDVLDIINKDEDWVKAQLEEQKLELNKVYIGEYLNGKLITHLYEKA